MEQLSGVSSGQARELVRFYPVKICMCWRGFLRTNFELRLIGESVFGAKGGVLSSLLLHFHSAVCYGKCKELVVEFI